MNDKDICVCKNCGRLGQALNQVYAQGFEDGYKEGLKEGRNEDDGRGFKSHKGSL